MQRARVAYALACIGATALVSCNGTISPAVSVAISPATATVSIDKTQQFTATVTGISDSAVTWAVVGGASNGTVTQTGLYSAPAIAPTPPQVTVTATSQANTSKSASATVMVIAASPVSVTVSPSVVSVSNFGTQQFTANVTGSSNTAVAWNVNGVAGGSQQFGFVSSSGTYLAPAGVPTTSNGSGGSVTTTVTVSAVSQANSNASGSAIVTIVPVNQAAQSGAIELGTSGGNANDSSTKGNTITCCSGTLGALVTRGGTQFILSNNHVIARSDLGVVTSSSNLGDSIIQPGLVDTSTCTATGARTVAHLTAFYNLESGSAPKIDAAIAQVVPGDVDPNGNILYLGATTDANGVPVPGQPNQGSGVAAFVSMPVAKSGRATGLTCSTVLAVGVSVNGVQYQKGCGSGTTFTVNYTNQVVIAGGSFSAEGDSGSLIVSQKTADGVALLYGGSDTDSVGNPVADVLNFFASGVNNVTFAGGAAHAVVGCSLPNKPASAASTVATNAVSSQALEAATAVRDAHAPELLAHPEVQAVGVGASYDNPHDAAIVFFVTQGQPHADIPVEVEGIRTRIIEGELFGKRGIISREESKQLEQRMPLADQVYSVSAAELRRAKAVHDAHAEDLLKQPGIQGVGISSSLDAPGEAALMIFLVRGVAHNPVPPEIDGVRTRIRESSRFKAGQGDGQRAHACSTPPIGTRKN